MTAPDAPSCYTVTRESLMDALACHPLTEHLTPERRERMADALLGMAGVPAAVAGAAPADMLFEQGQMAGIRAERKRIVQLAEERKARYPVSHLAEDGHLSMGSEPFAPLIREQP